MTELAVSFGLNNALIGVVSQPQTEIRENSPIVIILNSGLLHKVGPFRLSVDLARKFQSQGYVVLRMDISGVGDSKLRLQQEGEDAAVADVKSAMDYLSNIYQNNSFVLMGLCSGSDNSHRTVVADERVIGSVHLDGYGYINRKYYLKYYCVRLFSQKLLRQKIKKMISTKKTVSGEGGYSIDTIDREFPPIDQAVKEFESLMKRGVKMLHVYTRGVEYYYNYKSQLKDNIAPVKCDDNFEVELYRYDDHTYSKSSSRNKVVDRISRWLTAYF